MTDSVNEPEVNETTVEADSKVANKGEAKKGGRVVYKCFVGFLLVLMVLGGILTLRVNAQKKAVVWAEELGGEIVYEIMRDENGRDLTLDEMKEQPMGFLLDYVGIDYISKVVGVNLPQGGVDDLSPIAGLTQLEELWVEGNNISDISMLSRMKNLKSLSIQSNPVTDFSPIENLTKLEKVDFTGCGITDLTPMKNLTSLKRIAVKRTELTDVSPVCELPNLTELYLGESQIVDLSPISKIKKLEKLSIYGTPVSDLSPLSELPNLVKLEIHQSKVSDLSPLKSVKSLRSLSTWESGVTDEAIEALKESMPELKANNVKFVFGR